MGRGSQNVPAYQNAKLCVRAQRSLGLRESASDIPENPQLEGPPPLADVPSEVTE